MQKKKGDFVFNPPSTWLSLLLLLLFSISSGVQARGHHPNIQAALDKKISIEFKNVALKEALLKLEQLSAVSFSYVENSTISAAKVNIGFKNEKIADVLTKVLAPFSFSYTVVDDHIVIWSNADKQGKQKGNAAAADNNQFESNQPIHLKGVVTSEKQVPLPGVSVMIKGRAKGTVTGDKGQFELSDAGDSAVLVFSITGYKQQEVPVTAAKDGFLAVVLKEDAGNLQDVVVTGFQNIDKKKFAGAAVRLKAEDIKQDGMIDVSRMLEGRAAGVSVQNVSGTFGTAPKVRVRGATSINGDNKPLWVVDGVVLEDIINISNDQLSSGDPTTLLGSAVAGLNANDIESFDILKDASATALYGARAMNGVVVITTKKGRAGSKPAVSYTGNFSTQLKPTYGNFDIMNSAEQMSVLAELERKGMLTSDILSRGDIGVYGKMYSLLDGDNNGNFGLQNTPEARRKFLLRYAKANTDWFSLLFRNNLMQEHSLSISSGTDKYQSYFSTSFYGDNGWTIADDVKRYTLNFKNNYKLSDKFSAGFTTVGSVRQQRAPGALSRSSNPVEGQFDRDFDINPFSYSLNTSRTMTAYDTTGKLEYFTRNFAPFNIINELQNNYMKLNVMDVRLQGDMSWKFARNLKYEFVGSLRYVKSSNEHEVTENSNMANAYRAAGSSTIRQANKFLYSDPDNPNAEPVVVLPYGGFYNRTENSLANYDFRNSVSFTKNFGLHYVNILAGQQVKYADRQEASNTGYGYQYENGGVPFLDYHILKSTIEQNFPYYGMRKDYDRFVAFYSSGSYAFDNKYNVTGTVRYDGSNKLGQSSKARWLPTWSVAGSWNVEREHFLQDAKWLDFLTLRASYGLTASMGPATNSTVVLQNVSTNRPHLSETESVIQLAHLQNDDLTWEKLYTTNIGADAGFFNRRLTISADAYTRKSFDLISIIKTSGVGGEVYKAANYADMTSKGIEITIGGEPVRSKDFNWRTNVTFGYNTNKITNAKNDPIIFDLVQAEGGNKENYPVRSLFSLQYKGLDPKNGYPQFVNERGEVNPNVNLQDDSTQYLKYEGAVDPPVTGGLNNTFRYRNLSLNVFVSYQFGNKIRMAPAFKTGYSDLDAMPKEFYDRWVMPGDEQHTNIPSILDAYEQTLLGGAYPYNNYNYSSARVVKGDLVRLKSVSLTYQLPATAVRRIGFTGLSVSLSALNMWLIYSDKKLHGQDPEFFNAGGVAQPIQKQFTLSLKAGL
ncbi:SusC/RagA family TonB-linked outer membrane protein [Deminuibacter soli]|uniref:SusC/RagA family TonB-linked outer membrane protein n=1 Tax=Deminuibacter soli TaxID=2291815 RepID=A0A3E1NEI4_9BACT|nr:SusC/RagA family TonB-linked outer membrane protein [Deminuibacter soli]RFM26287.1 SusC/RagA family TonB-linked outer membrane protein [Deminuibacter soli]